MEQIGTISHVLEKRSGTSTRTGNAWASQDYVIEYQNGQYANHIVFTVFGEDKIAQFANLLFVGSQVKVSFDIDAREYQGRWYTSVRAWKVESASQQAFQGAAPTAVAQPATVAPATAPASVPPPAASAIPAPQSNPEGDDIPF